MFKSGFFCIIVVLTSIILGAAVYLQLEEMKQYNLLTKLYNEYIGSAFANDDAAAPAKDKKAVATDKKDDKK